MINLIKGNLLKADVEALVNTVNSVGFMGKGIALQFKKAFPENFIAYQKACRQKEVSPGKMFVFETGSMVNPKYIINFPTKRHWRGKSQLEYIRSGLRALINEIKRRNIHSVAIPPLGSGLGGLNWDEVRPMIEKALEAIPEVNVLLFEPAGAPDAKTMPIGTRRPNLTLARALLIKLMKQYSALAYRLTLLEIQKVAYFLQEGGERLRLRYDAGTYGPYAPNLNKVLETLEGHFIRGYGDTQKPDVEIELLPGAAEQADQFLTEYPDSIARLERVGNLIEGFETPYGMELLSSTHWVAIHLSPPARNMEDAIRAVHDWNSRKRQMFRADHIEIAWKRLSEANWIAAEQPNHHPIKSLAGSDLHLINADEIDLFLHQNEDLVSILQEISNQVRNNFEGVSEISVEYDRDEEENFDGLFILIKIRQPAEEAFKALSKFDNLWWLGLDKEVRQRMTVLVKPDELQVD